MVKDFEKNKNSNKADYDRAKKHADCSIQKQIGFVGNWGMAQKNSWNDPCWQKE